MDWLKRTYLCLSCFECCIKSNLIKMKNYLLLFFLSSILKLVGQIENTSQEIGIEAFFGASNQNGSFGIGPKYGFVINENYVVGPSFRIQRNWSNFLGNSFSQTIYGGGVFAHARYATKGKSTVYGAMEFEYLRSPFNFLTPNQQMGTESSRVWAPTLFLGGGFLIRVNNVIGINAGILYDVINANNSPFRSSYLFNIKNEAGVVQKFYP